MGIRESDAELNQLILQGKNMDGFEKYYADDVQMQENENPPTVGKDANRKREEEYIGKVTKDNGSKMVSSAVDEDRGVSMSEWEFDLEHQDFGHLAGKQVSVRRWKDGKIVHEKFYYNTGGK